LEDSEQQVNCISIAARGISRPGWWQKSKAKGDDLRTKKISTRQSRPPQREGSMCEWVQQ